MQTGYTQQILDNPQLSFKEFALICVRAMGVCISMRDDPMEIPIPNEFKVEQYYAEAVEKAKKELNRIQNMTEDERNKEANNLNIQHKQELLDYFQKANEEDRILLNMKNFVESWQPPTQDHQSFKNFMLEQINMSVNNLEIQEEFLENDWRENLTGETLLQSAIQTLENAEKYLSEEESSIKNKNQWLNELRDSL